MPGHNENGDLTPTDRPCYTFFIWQLPYEKGSELAAPCIIVKYNSCFRRINIRNTLHLIVEFDKTQIFIPIA
jgi:hypothetical protein